MVHEGTISDGGWGNVKEFFNLNRKSSNTASGTRQPLKPRNLNAVITSSVSSLTSLSKRNESKKSNIKSSQGLKYNDENRHQTGEGRIHTGQTCEDTSPSIYVKGKGDVESSITAIESVYNDLVISKGKKTRDVASIAKTEQAKHSQLLRSGSSKRWPSGKSSADDMATVTLTETRKSRDGHEHTTHYYRRGKLVGKGGFGNVYCCTPSDMKKTYAVKIIKKSSLTTKRQRERVQIEVEIHRIMKHKHICSYKHYFEDDKSCYLILELCHNQSMKELTKKRKYLSEPEVLFYMQQLIEAVQYMHENNIMHRDLKLGNLFLDKHLNIKVGDFGFATQIIKPNEKRNTARCGTPNYIAPEMLSKTKEGYSSEVDIWSMGIVCFTMLFGDPPFAAQDDTKATYVRILANDYWFPEDIPISHNARDFISSILQTNPVNRAKLNQMATHPFFSDAGAMIPSSLPSSASYAAPLWREDEHGNLVLMEGKDNSQRSRSQRSLTSSFRRVLKARDSNIRPPGKSECSKSVGLQ